jgi:hypothetical protein
VKLQITASSLPVVTLRSYIMTWKSLSWFEVIRGRTRHPTNKIALFSSFGVHGMKGNS